MYFASTLGKLAQTKAESGTNPLPRLLFFIIASIVAADLMWWQAAHFALDIPSYAMLGAIAALLSLAGIYYGKVRCEANLAAMLVGAAYLIAFSASFEIFNYFLLTISGPRIDVFLAAVDRWLGFYWPAVMAVIANHPVINAGLQLIYMSLLPQIAVLIIALGWSGRASRIYTLCLAISCGAAIVVTFWTLFPSFGAFSVYSLSPTVSHQLSLALDSQYAHELVALLKNGPGFISPQNVKGLIGFPSYHAALAVIVIWYGANIRFLRWPLILVNVTVIIATPIQGGHHMVDVLAGIPVAAMAIWVASRVSGWALRIAADNAADVRKAVAA